jgi:DNA-binding NtrC family response regulator
MCSRINHQHIFILSTLGQQIVPEAQVKSILVASENRIVCDTVRECFTPDYSVDTASTKASCLDKFRQKRYEFTFIDLELLCEPSVSEERDGHKTALRPFREIFPAAPIIVMSSKEMTREAVKAVRAGFNDYLTYPIDQEEVKHVVQNLAESLKRESELNHFRDTFWQADSLELVQTGSPVMREVLEKVRAVAPTKSTVLLTGETGTGKGVVAKLIHSHSHRRDKQFISTHCGAIPDTLLESELFGHEKGAFTASMKSGPSPRLPRLSSCRYCRKRAFNGWEEKRPSRST